jgi:hypothetical protein
MSRQVSPSTDKVYGLERVSRLWGVSRATIYRHRHRSEEAVRRRPGPQGAMADEGLVAAIQELLRDSPFHGEGHRKCGPGCALPASAPAGAAFCGSCARTPCWRTNVPAARLEGP